MKKEYLLIALTEPTLVNGAWLTTDGVSTEENSYLVGVHLGTYKDINEVEKAALDALTNPKYLKIIEHGIEIKTVFVKN